MSDRVDKAPLVRAPRSGHRTWGRSWKLRLWK